MQGDPRLTGMQASATMAAVDIRVDRRTLAQLRASLTFHQHTAVAPQPQKKRRNRPAGESLRSDAVAAKTCRRGGRLGKPLVQRHSLPNDEEAQYLSISRIAVQVACSIFALAPQSVGAMT